MFYQHKDPVSIKLGSIQNNSTDFHQGIAYSNNTESRNYCMAMLIFCFFCILLFIHSISLYLSHLDATHCPSLRNSLSLLRFGADHQEQRNEAELEIIRVNTIPRLFLAPVV